MIIYIDNDYKCHVGDAEGRVAVETDFFNGKCNEFIEGYRFIPKGASWTRSDGEVFTGVMAAPWKPYSEFQLAQQVYEQVQAQQEENLKQIEDMKAALELLGVTPDE